MGFCRSKQLADQLISGLAYEWMDEFANEAMCQFQLADERISGLAYEWMDEFANEAM